MSSRQPPTRAYNAPPGRPSGHHNDKGKGTRIMLTTTITFEGNIATDVELTYTPKGKPVVRFPVLVNQRKQDPETGDWVDGEPTRHACVAFGSLGEHIADSLGKGDRILVLGRVTTDVWADKDTGEKRTAQRVLVDAAGPSLRWATARVHKAQRATAEPVDAVVGE